MKNQSTNFQTYLAMATQFRSIDFNGNGTERKPAQQTTSERSVSISATKTNDDTQTLKMLANKMSDEQENITSSKSDDPIITPNLILCIVLTSISGFFGGYGMESPNAWYTIITILSAFAAGVNLCLYQQKLWLDDLKLISEANAVVKMSRLALANSNFSESGHQSGQSV